MIFTCQLDFCMAQLRDGRQRGRLVDLQHLQQTAGWAQQVNVDLLGKTFSVLGCEQEE